MLLYLLKKNKSILMKKINLILIYFILSFSQIVFSQKKFSESKLEKIRTELMTEIDKKKEFTAQMNDQIFSFAELGFQEFETTKYLTELLEKEGFTIERGIAGMPTAWLAKWGSGKPFIAIGSENSNTGCPALTQAV